jgi:hypothetical protein
VVLFTQSLPYLASVGVSILAAMPARVRKPVAAPVTARAMRVRDMHPAAGD